MKPSPSDPASGSEPRDPRSSELENALHEVSNALTVVLGWLEIARDRADDGAVRDAIDVAQSHARLGHGMARRAIGGSSPGAGVERSAAEVARAALLGVTPEAQKRRVTLRLETNTGVDDVVDDAELVAQILLNLLLNAVAFSPDGTSVSLAVAEADETLRFSVTDEGPGIAPDRVETLLDGGDSTRDGGAGIGLRHSRAAARSKGGELHLARPGPGACFVLSWPRAELRSGARVSSVPATRLEGTEILVLEDDPAVLGLIEVALAARGAKVVSVTSRAELELVTGSGFGAALLDLSPIADDPRAALDTLRQSAGTLPVVIISGSAAGLPDAVQDHVDGWVRKPFEMGEVIEVLRGLIGTR
ncbi:MAG: hybrid sensor histidine kinase/response regulator [Polyangiaceae bacterium]